MTALINDGTIASSFRDPDGFLFRSGRVLYRQVNKVCRQDYRLLADSGLYQSLVGDHLLIPHQKADLGLARTAEAFKIIRPETVPFISYPYEWCFSQLQDAALTTLAIQQRALEHGMVLKDASAYNIQFLRGKPILIDTLSFAGYTEGQPWVAYRQFCQHFLAPLTLIAYTDVRLARLLRDYIDGIPLDLASRLLPGRSRLKFGLLSHIHLHARSQIRHAGMGAPPTGGRGVSRLALRGLIDSLSSAVRGLRWKAEETEWAEYYDRTNYSPEAIESKRRLVKEYLSAANPDVVWDLGGNIGDFSRLAAARNARVICFDADPAVVEKCYREEKKSEKSSLLPLVMDLTNPSPALGWAGRERDSLAARGPADLIMALALIHHLAISNNIPLPMIAEYFSSLGRWLIVEFIPKEDSQVKRLLATRKDIFSGYRDEEFERAFSEYFSIQARSPIQGSRRILYLMGPSG